MGPQTEQSPSEILGRSSVITEVVVDIKQGDDSDDIIIVSSTFDGDYKEEEGPSDYIIIDDEETADGESTSMKINNIFSSDRKYHLMVDKLPIDNLKEASECGVNISSADRTDTLMMDKLPVDYVKEGSECDVKRT